MRRSNKISCEICGIKTTRVGNEKRTFMAKFPLNEDRCKQWVKVTGKEDLVYVPIEKLYQLKYLCGKHFRSSDFNKNKTQLKRHAVPSVGITAKPLPDDMLIGFPLHVQKDAEDVESSHCDHTYGQNSRTKFKLPIPLSKGQIIPFNKKDIQSSANKKTKLAEETTTEIDLPLQAVEETTAAIEEEYLDYSFHDNDVSEAPSEPTFSWQEQSTAVPCDSEFPEAPSEPTFSWQKRTAVPCDSGLKKKSPRVQCEETDDEIYMYDDDGGPSPAKVKAGKKTLPAVGEEPIRQEYKCNSCGVDITGLRYTCVQCPDYDLCAPCEARGAHAHHYVLRVPDARPYSEIQAVLATIRRVLLTDSVIHLEGLTGNELKLEIKEEPDPIYVEQVASPASSLGAGQPDAGARSAAVLLQKERNTSRQESLQDFETLGENVETLEENVEIDEVVVTDEDVEMLEEYIDSDSSESLHSYKNDANLIVTSKITSRDQRVYITSKITPREQLRNSSVVPSTSKGVIYKCIKKDDLDFRLLPADTITIQTRKRDACGKSNSDGKTSRSIALPSTDVDKSQSARLVAGDIKTLMPEKTMRITRSFRKRD